MADEKIHGLAKAAPPTTYLSFNQTLDAGTLLVRVDGDPGAVAASVRSVFREIDPALAVFGVEPLRQTVAESLGERQFTMVLLGSFAALTLSLALLGVYGALSYSVAQRTREIGLRLALGAPPPEVLRLVIGQGLTLVAAGLAVGIVSALLLTRLLTTLLFGITPTDPLTFAAAPLLLIMTAIVAAYVPARRASKVDPMVALRE